MRNDVAIGHKALREGLWNNVRNNRVPHAQFFIGPRGSGVLPVALEYARMLLCTEPTPDGPCGTCSTCGMVAKLTHPDLHLAFPIYLVEKQKTCDIFVKDFREAVLAEPWLDAEGWRDHLAGKKEKDNRQLRMGVDIAIEIGRKLQLKSYQGGWKVMLIWLPEYIAVDAANKLLKLLEEPEPRTAFILVGHDAGNMLPTITSRVQLVRVPRLGLEETIEALKGRYPDDPEEDIRDAALQAEGDLLYADMLLSGNGPLRFELFRDWLRACYSNNIGEVFAFGEDFAKLDREGQKTFLRAALRLIRQCILRWQGAHALLSVTGEEEVFIARFSTLLHARNAEGLRKAFELAIVHLERNAGTKVLFTDLSYRISELLRMKAA